MARQLAICRVACPSERITALPSASIGDSEVCNSRLYTARVAMPDQQSPTIPFTCRMKHATGQSGQCLPGEELCAFEFLWCEGCPKSSALKARVPEDPMQSIMWRGWISGIAGIRK